MSQSTNQQEKKPLILAPLITGLLFVGMWIFGVQGLDAPKAFNPLHPATLTTYFIFPVLLVGIFLTGLGIMRLIRLKRSMKNTTGTSGKTINE